MNKASAWVSQTTQSLLGGIKPPRPHTPSPPQQALERFHEALRARPEANGPAETRQDEALEDELLRFAHTSSTSLDLSAHGEALARLPAAVMLALAQLHASKGNRPVALSMPPALATLPTWVAAFGSVRALDLPNYPGRRLDLRELNGLEALSLTPVSRRSLTVLTPKNCTVTAAKANGATAHTTQRQRRGHDHWRIERQPANLNGAVKRQGSEETIYCRHMALAQLRAWDEQAMGADVLDPTSFGEVLSTPFALSQMVLPGDDAQFQRLMAQADSSHFVHHDAWGDFVEMQISDMQRRDETVRLGLLTSNNHAMAVRIVCRPDEAPYVECLDPNYAPRTARSEAPYRFRELFRRPERDMRSYFPPLPQAVPAHGFAAADHVQFTHVKDPRDLAGSLCPKGQSPVIGLAQAGLPAAMHPALIAPLLMEGRVEDIAPQIYRWLQKVKPSAPDFKALWMSDEEGEPSALTCAAYRGHAQAFDLMNEMLQFGFAKNLLSPEDAFDILRGTPNTTRTPLAYALAGNHPEVVDRFLRVLEELARQNVLSTEHVVRLLDSHRPAISSAEVKPAIGEAGYLAFKTGVERLARHGVIDAKTAIEAVNRLPRPDVKTSPTHWARV